MEEWREIDVPGMGRWQVKPAIDVDAGLEIDLPNLPWSAVPWRIRQRKQKSIVVTVDAMPPVLAGAIYRRWTCALAWAWDASDPD